jgi:hypothetical protein
MVNGKIIVGNVINLNNHVLHCTKENLG